MNKKLSFGKEEFKSKMVNSLDLKKANLEADLRKVKFVYEGGDFDIRKFLYRFNEWVESGEVPFLKLDILLELIKAQTEGREYARLVDYIQIRICMVYID